MAAETGADGNIPRTASLVQARCFPCNMRLGCDLLDLIWIQCRPFILDDYLLENIAIAGMVIGECFSAEEQKEVELPRNGGQWNAVGRSASAQWTRVDSSGLLSGPT